MSKVLYADIETTTLGLIKAYIDKFSSGTTLEELRTTGIASKLRMNVKKPDTLLVVLGQSVVSLNKAKLTEVLKNDKVHQYTDDATLNQWLSKLFGGSIDYDIPTTEVKVEEPQEKESEEEEEKFFEEPKPVVEAKPTEDFKRERKKLLGQINVLEETNENLRRQLQEALEESDLGDIREYKSKVADLEDKLIKKEGELRELHFEVDTYKNRAREMGTASVEVETLRKKISEAENNISSLTDEKEKLELKLEDITSSYEESQAQNESLITSIDTYKEELRLADEVKQKYDELTSEYTNVEEDCKSLREEVSNLSTQLSEAEKQLTDKEELESELEGVRKLVGVKQEKIITLEEELEEARDYKVKYKSVSNQLDSSKLENDSLKGKITELTSQSNELQSKIDELTGEKGKLESDLELKEKSLTAMSREIAELGVKLTECNESKDSLQVTLNELQSEKERIESELQLKETQVSGNTEEIDELHKTISDLKSELSKVGSEKSVLSDKITSMESQLSEKQSELEDLTEETDDLRGRVSEMQSKTATLASENTTLKAKLDSVQAELENADSDSTDKNARILELNDEIEKLRSKIKALEIKLDDSKNESTIMETDLENAKNSSEKAELELQSLKPELTKLKSTVQDLKTDIKSKDNIINSLKSTIEGLKKNGVSSSSSSEEEIRLKQEVLKAKDMIRERNDSIEELNDLVDELQSDIFMEVANSAMPKTAVTTELPVPNKGLNNVRLCVAGSGESNLTAYRVLHDETVANPNKKYLIVDLVNESFIDSTFGAKKIPSPLDWLEGRENIKQFVASSKEKNVKILSFGLNYMNDSYYLRVNWEERLEELNSLGINVIIYIGVIDCLVRNILFNSISKCCRTFVITKASPANLRACLLHLNSFPKVKHTTVLCAEYADSSQKMFNNLSKKYKTAIVEQGKPIGI